MNKTYLAVDLGATSGRVMAVRFDGERIFVSEVSRWSSEPVAQSDGLHWDANAILSEIVAGARKARAQFGDSAVSLAIDSWGVDYGLLDAAGRLINNPFAYRDARTRGMQEEVFAKISRGEIYAATGIQFMFFNTIYQLAAERARGVFGSGADKAKTFLMMPDLLAYMLTGEKRNERTNASTTQLYNPAVRDWAWNIVEAIGVDAEIFSSGFAEAGEEIGALAERWRGELGGLKVVAAASHDTASAVAATPSAEKNPVYVNSGTWSLVGIESDAPIINAESLSENFTNEVGAEGKIRFLKNVTGMWLVEQCRKSWARSGIDAGYAELEAAARACRPFAFIFDPDCADFASPDDMPSAIARYCERRGRGSPSSPGEFYRAIQESIALKYACVLDALERLSGVEIARVNVMGGGSRNAMLNAFVADATGREVVSGPVESAAIGNALVQMKAAGDISNLREGRSIVSSSFDLGRHLPNAENAEMWSEARERFAAECLAKPE